MTADATPALTAATPADATEKDRPEPQDLLVETTHTLSTVDGELSYTARTGRVVLREEEVKDDVFEGWKARDELAVTAYTLDTEDEEEEDDDDDDEDDE